MSLNFYGRETEIAWLREMFDACAARDDTGMFIGGPRMAFVIAESGIGKSRLVQELYLQLAADERWDPPAIDYWPETFQKDDAHSALYWQQRTVPNMEGHTPKGPPLFAWLGARWQSTEEHDVRGCCCSVLTELRRSVMMHAEILKSHGSVWNDATKRPVHSIDEDGETRGVPAERTGGPFVGLLPKIVRGTTGLVPDHTAGPSNFEQIEAEMRECDVDEALDLMHLLLNSKSAVPTVLWLDDAQWIDAESMKFFDRLWKEAQRNHWPLLIVVTQWEREWHELAHPKSDGEERYRLRAFEGMKGVECLYLTNAGSNELGACLSQKMPGLTASQHTLLIEMAAGNFLSMVENIATFQEQHQLRGWASRPEGPLSDDEVKWITDDHFSYFEPDRGKRVRERFNYFGSYRMYKWNTPSALLFFTDVIAEFVSKNLKDNDLAALMKQRDDSQLTSCEQSELTPEFCAKVFHHVASGYRGKFLWMDQERLMQIIRNHLATWINNEFNSEFDSEGDMIYPGTSARSVYALELEDEHVLVRLALHYLPDVPGGTSPQDVARQEADRLNPMIAGRIEDKFYDQREQELEQRRVDSIAAALDAHTAAFEEYEKSLVLATEMGTLESRRNVSVRLNHVAYIEEVSGDHTKALTTYKQSLAIRRLLAEELGTTECRRDLSVSLNIVAWLERMWSFDDAAALMNYKESLGIRRLLAEELGTPESRRDVVWSLKYIARMETGKADLRIEHDEWEDEQRFNPFYKENPHKTLNRGDMEWRWGQLGALEEDQNKFNAAMYEILEITRLLAEEFGIPEGRNDEPLDLNEVPGLEGARGHYYGSSDHYSETVKKHEESLSFRRLLAAEFNTPETLHDLSVSLCSEAMDPDMYYSDSLKEAALEEGIGIARLLAEKLGTPESHRHLIWALINAINPENWLDDHGTPARLEEILLIRRLLAKKLNTPESHRDVVDALTNAALLASCNSDLDAALVMYEEGLTIARLLATEPSAHGRDRVMWLLSKVASVEAARGNHDTAIARWEESLTLARLLDAELSTFESRGKVKERLVKMASFEARRGNLDAAFEKYEESLAIARLLATELSTDQRRPEVGNILKEIPAILTEIAFIEERRGNADAALAKYKESRSIPYRFDHRPIVREIAIDEANGDYNAAREKYERLLLFSRLEMKASGDHPHDVFCLSWTLQKFAECELKRGNHGAALAMLKEGFDLGSRILEDGPALRTLHDGLFRHSWRRYRDNRIQAAQFAAAREPAILLWEFERSKTEGDESPSASLSRLQKLTPLMRCEIELAMQPEAQVSCLRAQELVDLLVTTLEDPQIDDVGTELRSEDLFLCAEALELCARVHAMADASDEEDAVKSRAVKLKVRAGGLKTAEDETSEGDQDA